MTDKKNSELLLQDLKIVEEKRNEINKMKAEDLTLEAITNVILEDDGKNLKETILKARWHRITGFLSELDLDEENERDEHLQKLKENILKEVEKIPYGENVYQSHEI